MVPEAREKKKKIEGLSPKFHSKNLHYTGESYTHPQKGKGQRTRTANKQTKKITRNEGDELMYKWFLPNASEEKGNEQYKTTHQIKRSGEQTNQL